MGDGTSQKGQANRQDHVICRRCGRRSFHKQHNKCSHCAYPEPKFRVPNPGSQKYGFIEKAKRRRQIGVGRVRHIKKVESINRIGMADQADGFLRFERGLIQKYSNTKHIVDGKFKCNA